MALNKLNLYVSRKDFQDRISVVETKINMLVDVINRYQQAKANLSQFIADGDSNYDSMVEQIDEYVKNAKRAHAALAATKDELQATVDRMEGMGSEIGETITSAVEATKSAVEAAIKIDAIL